MKIVQNALFRSCAARFGQIAFSSVKVFKIVGLKFSLKRKNSGLFRSCAFLENRKTVRAFLKSSHWPEIQSKTLFQVMRSTFWPNRIFSVKVLKIVTGLKFSSKRENSAFSMKIVQNALFRSCAARFGQIAFLSVKVSKSSRGPEILFKTEKQCKTFFQVMKIVQNRHAFQVMRSRFWPNLIFERQSSQNRETGLKFSSRR